MRRALILLLAIAAAAWLQFQIFPGHSYLQGDSLVYVPALERLDAPGFLSRDLLAAHPHLTYTAYDEITLFLHEAARLTIQNALLVQQLVCRVAALIGVFLIVRSVGLGDIAALLLAALGNLGFVLAGPSVSLVDRDPSPAAFASALLLLGVGSLARGMPMLAGAAAGLAFAYSPAMAGPFWAVLLIAVAFDKRLRKALKPAVTILVVFLLLLANLAQLQPAIGDSSPFFSRISPRLAELQQFRTPFLWVSLWAKRDVWQYLAIYVCCVWSTVRIWKMCNRQLRWFLVALPLAGVLSVPFSALSVELLRSSAAAELQPAQQLIFTMAFAVIACGVAGVRSAMENKKIESWLWFVVVFAIPINSRVFDLLQPTSPARLLSCLICIALARVTALLLQNAPKGLSRLAVLAVPVTACFLLLATAPRGALPPYSAEIAELASWAEQNTWGSSMFLFPDAGREAYPALFRAESRRAVWVDWSSGDEVRYSGGTALEWWNRWQKSSWSKSIHRGQTASLLTLPIDYLALKRANKLPGVNPVYENSAFAVYDAHLLSENLNPVN